MSDEILSPIEDYVLEDFVSLTKRYSGFGQQIYQKLKETLPLVFEKLKFYKSIHYQTEHSYAVYRDESKSFGIQLDPLCEIIVLWNMKTHIEIGARSKDEYSEAIEFIEARLLIEGS